MLVHDYLTDTARRFPDRIALIAAGGRNSFRSIDEDSDRLALALQRLGVRRGDRVAAMLENSTGMVIALWASLKAGAVFVPINHGTKDDKLDFILADAEAVCLIAPAQLQQRVAAARAHAPSLHSVVWVGDAPTAGGHHLAEILDHPHGRPRDPQLIDQDLCLMIYTSGSTGRPKGVMMTHHAVSNNVWSISSYLGNVPEDVVLCVLPLSFNYGIFQVLAGARVGYATVLEKSFAYPYEVLKSVAEHRVTGLPGVPTIFANLLQFSPFAGLDLSSLRYMTNAAAPIPPAHILKLREMLPQVAFFSMYGLTECTRVAYLEPARVLDKIGSVGKAIPNSEVYVVGEDGHRLGPNEVGELVVRGSSIMRGYWRRPEETARTLRDGPFPGEKVLHTGDLFRMDEDGDLYFVGRKDDVFKCRGEKISPREIESILSEMEELTEAAVIGVPDPLEGMAIKAYVVPREGSALTETMVRRHCRARLEPHMVPKFVELCPSLPKTESGKVTKSVLRTISATAERPIAKAEE